MIARPLRLVLLGTESAFTDAALRALGALGHPPLALLRPRRVPGVAGVREVRKAPGATSRLPVYEVGRLDSSEAAVLLERLAPDLVVAACHPRRVPSSWLSAPRLGVWNIHPSLLPSYRGPVPVFWQLRAGETHTGVTVHRMDECFDTGPVLAQRVVSFPDGGRADEIDARLAECGAALVAELLAQDDVAGTPQDERRATRQGFPKTGDLELDGAWCARRAFRFLRGAAPWGPFRLTGPPALVIAEALDWSAGPPSTLPAGADGEALLAFSGGTVRVRLER